ncbi:MULTISPECIES: hypothetical protein [unclassified Flavobacterium]|uniref:hypothetical protein n=1 Tax=unclassified Flavobacterium TaxID=196869 RepID=UPI0006499020|nr:hypothetical protein [Flavobacterium sp. ABG]KLT67925.1 hypothetical protein AB674_20050 [Flavobacterium sp. ABG]
MSRRTELASAVATIKAKRNGAVPRVGQVELTDKTLYLNVAIKGQGGTVGIVDVNTKREVGVTNFDGNKLNAGRDYIIDSIRILRGSNASANLRNEVWDATHINSNKLFDAAFLNAELRIKQDGNVLTDMPITDLTGDTTNFFRNLSTSPLIRSNMEFEIEIEYPKGVAVATTAEVNVRFEFRVHQAKR